MKNFLDEFKAFALKGNVLDLAVAVVIGAAFGKIVTSIVEDLITPLIGLILGKIDFGTLMLGPVKIGSLINNVINFVIVALAIFVMIKFLNRAMRKKVGAIPDVDKGEDMK
ncbi:MAG: large conductance mechanosensitive channel protein MscL [Patescibacteria group bacterium]